jgi:hypothetical protein
MGIAQELRIVDEKGGAWKPGTAPTAPGLTTNILTSLGTVTDVDVGV